ncbi:hypothetical protein SNE40_010345 [Patella caerulea]|uniref:Uncharacterized protein n=1 Tax=Patella caerulea TaxID=87958 RepID=A0AAN8PSR2_PATCE
MVKASQVCLSRAWELMLERPEKIVVTRSQAWKVTIIAAMDCLMVLLCWKRDGMRVRDALDPDASLNGQAPQDVIVPAGDDLVCTGTTVSVICGRSIRLPKHFDQFTML